MHPTHDGWITIPTTPRKPHAQEHDEAWFDRLLGLPPCAVRAFRLPADAGASGGEIEVRADGGPIERRALPATRLAVLHAVERRARGLPGRPDWQRSDGGAVVLCDEAREHFLLTRKDDSHPNPRCRGRLALVSGALEPGETFHEGALRELHEEVRDLSLVDAAAALARPLTTALLTAHQHPGTYRLGVLLCAAPAPLFARWRAAWSEPSVLSEATPLCLDRAALLAAIADEEAHPGTVFVASHHILRLALDGPR